MNKNKFLLTLACLACSGLPAYAGPQTYTNTRYLYAVDYPENWRVKEVSKVTTFLSPFESKEDKFAENVVIVVEDLRSAIVPVTLLDYHRQSLSDAPKQLPGFKLLEEAKTEIIGLEAIAMLYTAKLKGRDFKFKDYKFMVGQDAYVMTYTALAEDYDKYLPAAEKIMHSLRVGA